MSDKIAEIRARHDAADEDRLETIWRAGLAMRGAVQEIKGLRVEVEKLAQERDEARAEVERLTRERDEARSKETDYGEGFDEGWAAAQKGVAAEVERLHKAHEAACRGGEWLLAEKVSLRARMCGEISDLRAENERLIRERDEARAGIERLSKAHEAACGGDELLRAAFARLLDRLTRERDEARAEVERLLLGSEVLASHQGSPGREWHGAGAWLYPGDSINVVRAPLEAKP